MYYVSVQGIDEHVINVHYHYHYVCHRGQPAVKLLPFLLFLFYKIGADIESAQCFIFIFVLQNL